MSISNKFTPKAQNALELALDHARRLGHTYVGSEHLLLGLLSECDSVSAKLLSSHGISVDDVKKSVVEVSGLGVAGDVSVTDMTPSVKWIIERSSALAKKYSQKSIGTEHLLLALCEKSECVGVRILESLSISIHEIKNELTSFVESTSLKEKRESADVGESKKDSPKIAGCPYISEFGKDLTALARAGRLDPITAREGEIERVIQILSRRTKNNPCIIGEPGVGKTAIVEGLASKIAIDDVPDMLKDKIIVTLDVPSMVAGAKYRGEFEERMKKVMRECAQNPDVILFIDEFHTIIGAGGAEGAVDAANIIKPALARGEMQVIGATTISEYRRHIEKDSALERRFQSVMVDEPSAEDAKRILQSLKEKYEIHHGLKISDEAIEAAVKLSSRYIPDRFLPDKAIDLIDEAAAMVKIRAFALPPELKSLELRLKQLEMQKESAIVGQDFEGAAVIRDEEKAVRARLERDRAEWELDSTDRDQAVSEEDIAEIVSRWTSIPTQKLVESENERLLKISERLKSRVIGQDEAVEALANSIKRGRVGISDPSRPIGSFIFLGPTGVGKTELARAVAWAMFGSEESLIRFDMSEYMEKHSVSKLIGSPPGYVGYEEGGRLTERVRRRPYSVVLFDEIEKADSDIFNILLQILDDGVLTDSQGSQVNFRNTIIIMTSNVGSPKKNDSRPIGFSAMDISVEEKNRRSEKARKALYDTFQPEFLNRVDQIISFSPLSREAVKQIAKILLKDFVARAGEMQIEVEFDGDAVDKIVDEGYDSFFGARPLRRAITRIVEDEFSRAILEGEIKRGDKILISVSDEAKIAFNKQECSKC